MAIYAKLHEQVEGSTVRRVIAACDEKHLGKVLEGPGEALLDLKTYRRFYEGEKVTEEELIELLDGAENVNLVGEQAITVASRVLPIDAKKARKIGGVPHLQFYRI